MVVRNTTDRQTYVHHYHLLPICQRFRNFPPAGDKNDAAANCDDGISERWLHDSKKRVQHSVPIPLSVYRLCLCE